MGDVAHAHRCDPGYLRHASHHLHYLDGTLADLVEDQITYPIVTALLSAPNVTVVRGFSDFGYSYVYILFKDGTDIYWARSRILERLNQLVRPYAGRRHASTGS